MSPLARVAQGLTMTGILLLAPLAAECGQDLPFAGGKLFAEIVETGEYRNEGQVQITVNTSVPDQTQEETTGVVFLTHSMRVPARLGASFGFRFNIRNLDKPGRIAIDVSVRHPAFPSIDGEVSNHYEMKQELIAHNHAAGGFLGYRIDDEAEAVRGRWLFECRYEGQLIMTQEFVLAGVDDRRKASADRKQQADTLKTIQQDKPITVAQAVAIAWQRVPDPPRVVIPQATRRLDRIARHGYRFAREDTDAWRGLLRDEAAGAYARMCASRYLLEAQDAEARQFLETMLDTSYRRYVFNAASVALVYCREHPADAWARGFLAKALQDNRLLTTMTDGDFSSLGLDFPDGDERDMLAPVPDDIRRLLSEPQPAPPGTSGT